MCRISSAFVMPVSNSALNYLPEASAHESTSMSETDCNETENNKYFIEKKKHNYVSLITNFCVFLE